MLRDYINLNCRFRVTDKIFLGMVYLQDLALVLRTCLGCLHQIRHQIVEIHHPQMYGSQNPCPVLLDQVDQPLLVLLQQVG